MKKNAINFGLWRFFGARNNFKTLSKSQKLSYFKLIIKLFLLLFLRIWKCCMEELNGIKKSNKDG